MNTNTHKVYGTIRNIQQLLSPTNNYYYSLKVITNSKEDIKKEINLWYLDNSSNDIEWVMNNLNNRFVSIVYETKVKNNNSYNIIQKIEVLTKSFNNEKNYFKNVIDVEKFKQKQLNKKKLEQTQNSNTTQKQTPEKQDTFLDFTKYQMEDFFPNLIDLLRVDAFELISNSFEYIDELEIELRAQAPILYKASLFKVENYIENFYNAKNSATLFMGWNWSTNQFPDKEIKTLKAYLEVMDDISNFLDKDNHKDTETIQMYNQLRPKLIGVFKHFLDKHVDLDKFLNNETSELWKISEYSNHSKFELTKGHNMKEELEDLFEKALYYNGSKHIDSISFRSAFEDYEDYLETKLEEISNLEQIKELMEEQIHTIADVNANNYHRDLVADASVKIQAYLDQEIEWGLVAKDSDNLLRIGEVYLMVNVLKEYHLKRFEILEQELINEKSNQREM